MSYIGNQAVSTDFPVDYFSGNGSTVAFTLSIAPASVNAIDVEVSGVSQSPQSYTVSGTTLTFTGAPPLGSSNIVVKHRGIAGIPNTPSAASVVTSSIADANVTQAKLAANVAGNGPAFSATLVGTNQSVTAAVTTKCQFSVKEFDTNSNYDNVTNYRFTPTVAGYYEINLSCYIAGTSLTQQNLTIYKNGSAYKGVVCAAVSGGTVLGGALSTVIYLNGSTDYVEAYTTSFGTSPVVQAIYLTYFNGAMVRSA